MDTEYRFLRELIETAPKYSNKRYHATPKQMERLSEVYGKLPAAYEEFMQMMGNSDFLGEDGRFDSIFTLREHCLSYWRCAESSVEITKNDFIFAKNQKNNKGDKIFWFLKLGEGQNPPVYRYLYRGGDGIEIVTKQADSFTEFLIQCVNERKENQLELKWPTVFFLIQIVFLVVTALMVWQWVWNLWFGFFWIYFAVYGIVRHQKIKQLKQKHLTLRSRNRDGEPFPIHTGLTMWKVGLLFSGFGLWTVWMAMKQ